MDCFVTCNSYMRHPEYERCSRIQLVSPCTLPFLPRANRNTPPPRLEPKPMLDRTQSASGRLLLFLPIRGFLHPQTLLLRLFTLLLEERLIDVLFTPDQRSGGT
jgi:hypothetical protein